MKECKKNKDIITDQMRSKIYNCMKQDSMFQPETHNPYIVKFRNEISDLKQYVTTHWNKYGHTPNKSCVVCF